MSSLLVCLCLRAAFVLERVRSTNSYEILYPKMRGGICDIISYTELGGKYLGSGSYQAGRVLAMLPLCLPAVFLFSLRMCCWTSGPRRTLQLQ